MPAGDEARRSILSHGERAVADELRADPDADPEAIASARGTDVEAVEKSIDRIREKTDRAVATLLQSPFAVEALADLEEAERAAIREALVAADEE